MRAGTTVKPCGRIMRQKVVGSLAARFHPFAFDGKVCQATLVLLTLNSLVFRGNPGSRRRLLDFAMSLLGSLGGAVRCGLRRLADPYRAQFLLDSMTSPAFGLRRITQRFLRQSRASLRWKAGLSALFQSLSRVAPHIRCTYGSSYTAFNTVEYRLRRSYYYVYRQI